MRVSSKLGRTTAGHYHWCPGCESMHVLPDSWTFDGNVESPTFSPSFLHKWNYGPERTPKSCHYIVTAGILNYCGDCHHALRGTSVPIPDLPYEY